MSLIGVSQSFRARPCWRTDYMKEASSVFSALSVNAPMRNCRFARQCIDGQISDYALAHWRTKRRWRRKLPSYDPSVNMAAPLLNLKANTPHTFQIFQICRRALFYVSGSGVKPRSRKVSNRFRYRELRILYSFHCQCVISALSMHWRTKRRLCIGALTDKAEMTEKASFVWSVPQHDRALTRLHH